jgi:hypothetical protein
MANMYINAMTALWNSVGTIYSAIKMNVSDSGSHADSKLIDLQVASVPRFNVKKNGDVMTTGLIAAAGAISSGGGYLPATADGGAVGSSALPVSDVFIASGGVINWAAADVTITHSSNLLAFAGASGGYSFDASLLLGVGANVMMPVAGVINFGAGDVTVTHATDALAFAGAANGYSFSHLIKPAVTDGAALGSASFRWSDLFAALGAVIDIAGDWIATHTAGILTVGTGDFRVTNAGANTASVVTVGGTQTLLNKTMTAPVLNTPSISNPAFSGTPTGIAATTAVAGLSRLATNAEAQAKADTATNLTPSNLAALNASTTFSGLSEMADNTEAQAKADATRSLSPANLAALGATTGFAGLVALATNAEAIAGTDTTKAVTPAAMEAAFDAATNANYIMGYFDGDIADYGFSALRIVVHMPFAGTVTNMIHKMAVGNLTVTLKINGTAITGINATTTDTTKRTATATGANTFAVGDYLELAFGSVAFGDADFSFLINVSRSA